MDSIPGEQGQILEPTQALLVYYGKASVYLKGRALPRPEQWLTWIA